MTNPNDATYPRNHIGGAINAKDVDGLFWERQYHGLTKREWYAGLAMQGLLANSTLIAAMSQATPGDPFKAAEGTAMWALIYADAMITELNKQEPAK